MFQNWCSNFESFFKKSWQKQLISSYVLTKIQILKFSEEDNLIYCGLITLRFYSVQESMQKKMYV